MKKLLGIIVLGLLLSGNANATLKGIFEVELIIETITDVAESCSITKQKIETTTKYILQSSKIRIVKSDLPIPILYISVAVGNNKGTCYTNTAVEVFTFSSQDPLKNGNTGIFRYYDKASIAAGGEDSNIGDFVISQLERILKDLVVTQHEDNQ